MPKIEIVNQYERIINETKANLVIGRNNKGFTIIDKAIKWD